MAIMRELKRQIVFGLVAALFGFAGGALALGFLCFGLFFGLTTAMGAAWAAVLTGVIVLVVTGAVIVMVRMLAMPPRPHENAVPPRRAAAGSSMGMGSAAWYWLRHGRFRHRARQSPGPRGARLCQASPDGDGCGLARAWVRGRRQPRPARRNPSRSLPLMARGLRLPALPRAAKKSGPGFPGPHSQCLEDDDRL